MARPYEAKIRAASSVIRTAVSEAKSFVMAASRVTAPAGVEPRGRLVGHEERRVERRQHVGELEADGLVLGDRLAEGDPLARVARAPPGTRRGRAPPRSPRSSPGSPRGCPPTFSTPPVSPPSRCSAGTSTSSRRISPVTEARTDILSIALPSVIPRIVRAVQQEQRDVLHAALVRRLGGDGQQIGDRRAGHPRLRSAQHVAIAAPLGPRRDVRRRRSRRSARSARRSRSDRRGAPARGSAGADASEPYL